ncbi:MAG: nodulation protein NfeD [Myxococcota bacterium]|nr:nodulation protein NfeD [Myxococcota bacterium]
MTQIFRSNFIFCLLLALIPVSANAQFPIPLPGQTPATNKPKNTKPASPKKAKESDSNVLDKEYAKPEPKPLPEGEVKDLKGSIVLVDFRAIVNPGMGEFTNSSIERAEKENAQAVLIEMDTPGGLVSTTQKMVQAIMASKIPVIVFVSPSGAHAASAGTIITMAAHVAAMAPATRIGAAHPVTGGGKDPEESGGKHMGKKIENDLAAMIEGIANERGRNEEWAIDAVRESVSVHAQKALEIGVIDLVANDRDDLFEQLEGRVIALNGQKVRLHPKGAEIVEYELSMRERMVNMLANPGIAMILGILGLIGIMVEVYNPGMIAPGVMGVLAVICSLIAVEQLPIDLGAAILVIAGIGLLIAELYTPTYGALGILGAIGLTIGLLLLVDPSNPDFAIDPSVRLGPKEVLPAVLSMVLFMVYVSYTVLSAQKTEIFTGSEGLVGKAGVVLKSVSPSGGMVLIEGEYWKATASHELAVDASIRVSSVSGLELRVEADEDAQDAG